MQTLPPLILASMSPRRAELLRHAGFRFQVVLSKVSEAAHEHFSPLELCQLNAHRKTRAVAKKFPDALVIGADTLVFLDGEILGKPMTLAEAQAMLARLQGRTHQVVTGVDLIHLRTHKEKVFAVSTDVRLRALTADQIRSYLSQANPLDKAALTRFRNMANGSLRKFPARSPTWSVCRWSDSRRNWQHGRAATHDSRALAKIPRVVGASRLKFRQSM